MMMTMTMMMMMSQLNKPQLRLQEVKLKSPRKLLRTPLLLITRESIMLRLRKLLDMSLKQSELPSSSIKKRQRQSPRLLQPPPLILRLSKPNWKL
jgi:hypothetical protein